MLSALRSRDFRLLWISQSASVIGDGLVIVAIGLFVTRLTGDPGDVGIVLAAYALPLVAFVLVGGVIADRLPRQALMVVTDAVRGVLHGVLALLIVTGVVRIWHLVVIGLLFGTAQAFFQPAYTGLVPQTVAEGDIQAAQALGGVSRELASFVSPALATALVLTVGGAAAFGLDAVTFVISAVMLSRIRARPRGEARQPATGGADAGSGPGSGVGSVLIELREGWTVVRERAWVWATIAAFSASLLVALAPFFVLGPSVSRHVYGTEAVFGITNTAWGVGTILGAVVGARWRPRRPMFAGMLASVAWPGQIALFAVGPPLLLLYPVTAVSGFGLGLFGVWWETALAQRIPPNLLSRVSAWDWMGSLALLPAGYLLAGPAARWLGDVQVLVGGGLIGLAAFALGLLPASTRHLLRIDAADPTQADAGAAPRPA